MTAPVQLPVPSEGEVTVLMPVWRGDRPERFAQALASATIEQTEPPAELVLVIDGPLGEGLEAVVTQVEDGAFGPARVVRASAHEGLARALQRGLEACRTDIIARADADDLCRPQRLALQRSAMEQGGLDLLSSAMQEFSDSTPRGGGALRTRPLAHQEILDYLPRHSPFHHPAVMLRRSTALAVGGYRALDFLEDYWLWERMLLGGARSANLPEVLVDYRVDADLFARRGGWRMFVSDLRLQRIFRADGLIGPRMLALNLARRAAYRFAPGWLRRIGYRLVVERMR